MNKTKHFLMLTFIFILISASSVAFAQSTQNLILKPGFNFVSFSVTPTVSAAAFKSSNPAIENIFVYSAAAGSFLSVNEGTLTTLAAGKGYIVKNSNTSDLTIAIPGSVPATIGNINLKTGFNLIGFAKTPAAVTFNKLMDVYPIIKGLYKWSTSAGGFIQVIRNESGVPVQLDGINPSFKAGESYFINMAGDTTLNYDGADVIVGSGPVIAASKTLEVSGQIGSVLKTPYLTSISRLIDNTGYRISIFDEINNQPLEDSTVSFIAADTYRAVIKTASTTKYASIIIKNLENKVVYKIFLGRIPKSEEISDSSIMVTNLRIDDSSTARAIVISGYKSRIPASAIIANKSLDASIEETVFVKETKSSFGNINSIVSELEKVVSVIRGVLAKETIESFIRSYIEVSTHDSLNNTLNAYVKLLNHFDYLSYKQGISIPAYIYIGAAVLKEGSTSETVQKALSEAEILINKTILKSIELDKVTDSVLISKQYDLSLITAMAVYSDNSKKKIIPYWKRQSGKGTVWVDGGKWVFDASSETGETILDAGYDEDNGTVTRLTQLTLQIVSDKPVIAAPYLVSWGQDYSKPRYTNVKPGEKILLNNIRVALYSNGTTRDVKVAWKVLEGAGSLAEVDYYTTEYTAPVAEGVVKFEESYSDGGVTLKPIQSFNFNVTNNSNIGIIDRQKASIGPTGGRITLYSGISIVCDANDSSNSAEVTLSDIVDTDIKDEYNNLFELSIQGSYKGKITLSIPGEDPNLSTDCILLEAIDKNTSRRHKFPVSSINNVNQSGPNRFGIVSIIEITLGVCAVYSPITYPKTLRYLKYKPEKPINNSVLLNVPFYNQYYGECGLASLLMCLKSIGIKSSINEMAFETGIDIKKTNANGDYVGFSDGIQFDIDTWLFEDNTNVQNIRNFLSKRSIKLIDISSITKSQAEFINRYVIKPLDEGRPVIMSYIASYTTDPNASLFDPGTWSFNFKTGHSYVVVGYSGGDTITSSGDYSKVTFYVNDPSHGAYLPYTYKEFTEKLYSNIRTLSWTLSPSNSSTNNPYTIHLPDGVPNSASGVGYKLKQEDASMADYISWDYTKPNGYAFNKSKTRIIPTNFYDINANAVPIFNVSSSDTKLNIVNAIYNDNNELIVSSSFKTIDCDSAKGKSINSIVNGCEFTTNSITKEQFVSRLPSSNSQKSNFKFYTFLLLQVSTVIPGNFSYQTINYVLDYYAIDLFYEMIFIANKAGLGVCPDEVTLWSGDSISLGSYINSTSRPAVSSKWSFQVGTPGSFEYFNENSEIKYTSVSNINESYSFDLTVRYKTSLYSDELSKTIKIKVIKR